MAPLSKMKVSDVDIEILAQVIREAGRPVHVNKLAREFVRARLLTETREARRYTPSATYTVGDKVRWKGNLGDVKAVSSGENPRQGKFVILTLVFPDGKQNRLAAKRGGEEIQDQESVSDRKIQAIVNSEDGLKIRAVIRDAMDKDERFVCFEDTQGENWCLTEMLPEVQDSDLAKALPLLQGLLKDGVLPPRPTEELVKAIWGQSNDGSDEYAKKAFALNVTLQRCNDMRWIGNGWVLEAEWQKLQEREVLIGPRQTSEITLPEGVTLDTSDLALRTTEEVEEEEPEEQETTIPEDLEAWRRNRRRNATITLRASYYYGNWLRLIKDMQRVFPPRASGADSVTFYHRFGGEEESFQAWVDWNHGRILGSPQMYQAFYDYGIYPGAVLVISHRENEQEYDIRTKPPTKDETVRVRRIFFATDENGNWILDGDGHPKLEYEEVDEPLRYDVADEVFIVGASWENLPELFAEAERVGQGYFGLMYQVCCEWWEANGRKPLYVTADELFQEIHYNRRLVTSEATIPWELWRRLAFKPVGDGRYLFRPQMGDRTRAVGPSKRPARTPKQRREVMAKGDKSLLEIARQIQPKITRIKPEIEVTPDFLYPIPFLEREIDLHLKKDIQQLLGLGADETTLFPVEDGLFTSAIPKFPESLDRRLIQFYSDKSENRFVTPREVADLMVNLAQPGPGEKVIDICCGTGIFLVKALNFVRQRSSSEADLKLFGVDKEANGAEATKISLAANSAKDFKVICGDSLSDDLELFSEEFDLILGNPPFGRNIEVNFLKRWAQLVGEGGRIIVNTADGVLANTSTRDIRDWLVEHFNIRAVISLPRPSDSETYGAKSNILVLQNDESSKHQPTLLAEITDYEQIPDVIRRFLEMDNSKEVNVGETVIVSEEKPMIVLKNQEDLRERMDPGFWHPEYLSIASILKKGSFELRNLGEFVIHEGQGDTPRKNLGEKYEPEGIQFISAEDILPTGVDFHNYKFISKKQHERLSRTSLKKNDILFARIGVASIGRVAIVTDLPGPCNINNSLNVFRLQGISPFYATCLLKSKYGQKQIEHLKRGVASVAITIEQIKSIMVPVLFSSVQLQVENAFKDYVAKYHNLAMEAKGKGDDISYMNNISIAEKILSNLVQQLEEIIEEKREEIEPVDI